MRTVPGRAVSPGSLATTMAARTRSENRIDRDIGTPICSAIVVWLTNTRRPGIWEISGGAQHNAIQGRIGIVEKDFHGLRSVRTVRQSSRNQGGPQTSAAVSRMELSFTAWCRPRPGTIWVVIRVGPAARSSTNERRIRAKMRPRLDW
jgi:hypothetical protein